MVGAGGRCAETPPASVSSAPVGGWNHDWIRADGPGAFPTGRGTPKTSARIQASARRPAGRRNHDLSLGQASLIFRDFQRSPFHRPTRCPAGADPDPTGICGPTGEAAPGCQGAPPRHDRQGLLKSPEGQDGPDQDREAHGVHALNDLLVTSLYGTLGGLVLFGVPGVFARRIIAVLFSAVRDRYGAAFKDLPKIELGMPPQRAAEPLTTVRRGGARLPQGRRFLGRPAPALWEASPAWPNVGGFR
jgi:hypothetical protein